MFVLDVLYDDWIYCRIYHYNIGKMIGNKFDALSPSFAKYLRSWFPGNQTPYKICNVTRNPEGSVPLLCYSNYYSNNHQGGTSSRRDNWVLTQMSLATLLRTAKSRLVIWVNNSISRAPFMMRLGGRYMYNYSLLSFFYLHMYIYIFIYLLQYIIYIQFIYISHTEYNLSKNNVKQI